MKRAWMAASGAALLAAFLGTATADARNEAPRRVLFIHDTPPV